MGARFKYGDKVKAKQHIGKIVSVKSDSNGYVCRVKFENKLLIPQEMDYAEFDLELVEASKIKQMKCTCGIQAAYGNIPKENHSYYCDLKKPIEEVDEDFDDLLSQFELMLGNDDDDDDDDFFAF
jgi:hypothetical protein